MAVEIEKCRTCFHLEGDDYCRCGGVNIEDSVYRQICDHYLSVEDGMDPDRIKGSLGICSGKAFRDGVSKCWTGCPYHWEICEKGPGEFLKCRSKLMGDALRIMNVTVEGGDSE